MIRKIYNMDNIKYVKYAIYNKYYLCHLCNYIFVNVVVKVTVIHQCQHCHQRRRQPQCCHQNCHQHRRHQNSQRDPYQSAFDQRKRCCT